MSASAAHATLKASIVAGNSFMPPATSQFAGNCTLSNVVTGATDAWPGSTEQDPQLVTTATAGMIQFAPMNKMYCIDAIQPGDGGASSLPSWDYYGTPRPQGSGWDIGAVEVPSR